MVRARGRRLKFVAALVGTTFAIYTLLYLTVWSADANLVGRTIGVSTIIISLGVVAILQWGRNTAFGIAALGIGFELFLAFALAFTEYYSTALPDIPSRQVSWTCILIILFPFVVPAKPRTLLVAALAAAAASPIAYAVAHSLGLVLAGTPSVLLSIFLPQFLCAGISYLPARLLNKLGTEASRARRLGSYELLDKLGEGGMGEVWRAEHQLLSRPAAIKTVRLDAVSGPQRVELEARFKLEAQTTALLESPNTVELYDFGISEDGLFYYVMELLDGTDLQSLVAEHGPQSAARVVHVLLQACDSLAEAHAAGLVHRDIKPANIFVAKRGRQTDVVKVLDFGLVKASTEHSRVGVNETDASVIRGTPAYLAPESIVDGAVDGRADIYALGCVAYWLLTGELVFAEETAMKMAIAHATKEPAPPSAAAELNIPDELETLIMKCLAKSPNDRPQTAEELEAALNNLGVARWTAEDANLWWTSHPNTSRATAQSGSTPTRLVPRNSAV